MRIPFNGGLTFPDSTGNSVILRANTTVNEPYSLTLPDTNGSIGQVLQTDGNGVLTWATGGSSSIAADDITIGDSEVTVSTSVGNVNLNAPTGSDVKVKINNTDVAVVGSTGLDVTGTVSASTSFIPDTNDGATLGTSSLQFSDLFLASGAVVNFNNGDVTMTHATNAITFAGGNVAIADNNSLYIRNANTIIRSPDNGNLAVEATGEIQLTSLNGTINASNMLNLTASTAIDIFAGPGEGSEIQMSIDSEGVYVYNDVTINNNLTVERGLKLGIDFFSEETNRYDLFSSGNIATIKNIVIKSGSLIADSFYDCNAAPEGAGSIVHFFFTNESSEGATANISFLNSNLFTGSGSASYLVFNQTGQSASLIYLTDEDMTAGWRILNVGGQIF